MSHFDRDEHPHIRYNPLKDEWVLVSPHRTKRPWQGQVEAAAKSDTKRFDPTNPLCPGVQRPNGVVNPLYESTYSFDNDFPALFEYDLVEETNTETATERENSSSSSSNPTEHEIERDLFQMEPAKGVCKVICFHPHSDLTLATMEQDAIVRVLDTFMKLLAELRDKYDWVQLFENKGAIMGCSNAHPHSQLWASNFVPNEVRVKHRTQLAFYRKHAGRVLLVEYLRRELEGARERLVLDNADWAVVVPYWAVWPYETLLLPKRHVVRLGDLSAAEVRTLADIIKRLLTKYDNLFGCSFPYSMGFHFAPTGRYLAVDCAHWQLHACYLPPLLRSATVKKFMVGYELLAQPQRDLSPEKAAATLRALSDTQHYSDVTATTPTTTTTTATSAT